jgi:hypothetical protein
MLRIPETGKGAKQPARLTRAEEAAKAAARPKKMRSAARLAEAREQTKRRSLFFMGANPRRHDRHIEQETRLAVAQATLSVTSHRKLEAEHDRKVCQQRVNRLNTEVTILGHRIAKLSPQLADASTNFKESYLKVQYSVRQLAEATVGEPRCNSNYKKILSWLLKEPSS